jgi:hypothetical protein
MEGVGWVVKDGWGGWLTEGSSRGPRLACEAVVSRADRVESGYDICALWRDLAEHVPLVWISRPGFLTRKSADRQQD